MGLLQAPDRASARTVTTHSAAWLAAHSQPKNQRRCPQVVQYRTPPAGAILDRASKRVVVDAVGKVIENF
jgi:hypothetical protein